MVYCINHTIHYILHLFSTAACATEVFKIATRLVNPHSGCLSPVICYFVKGVLHNISFCFFSSAYIPLNNYLVFNDVDGLYTYTFEAERKVCFALSRHGTRFVSSVMYIITETWCILNWQENCSACSQVPQDLQFPPSAKLQEVLEYLTENASLWVLRTDETLEVTHKNNNDHVKVEYPFPPRQMKSPAITTTLEGKNKTLYLQVI